MLGLIRSFGVAFTGAACVLATASSASAGDARASKSSRAELREIEQSVVLVRVELRLARGTGDWIGARCASEKLSEVHAQLRLANEHASAVDPAKERYERFVLETARDRARELAR